MNRLVQAIAGMVILTNVIHAADIPRKPLWSKRASASATSNADRPKQLWVKWKTATFSVARARTKALGETLRFSAHGNQAIRLLPEQSVEQAARILQQQYGDDIEFAVENKRVSPAFTPNDSLYSLQYHLPLPDFPEAWDSTRGSGITIAIADSGVTATHADLSANVTSGYNTFLENTTTTDAVCGHGTWVAGVAAAVGNNAAGVTGGAFQSTILPVKIVDDSDCEASLIDIDEAIRYAADRGAKVVNVSFGSDIFCDTDFLRSAAQYMRARGGSVVKSAGNIPINKGCSDVAEVVVVSATDQNDALTSFSNFGNDVDIAAPGENIYTTDNGGGYAIVDGTSFSSPLTASVLALIYAIDPSFTASRAEQILFDSAQDLGAPGRDIYFGYGRIDAGRAVALAAERSIAFQRESLSNVYAYPNPWDVRRGHAPQIKFANLPDGATVKIYTLAGFWVQTLQGVDGQATWDMRNQAGDNIASGLYFYVISAGTTDNIVKGKLAVIR